MKRLIFHLLISGSLLFGAFEIAQPLDAQIRAGITIGPPPAPRVLHSQPRRPGPDYVWVDGYWYPKGNGKDYKWHDGYWTRVPFEGAHWIPPHHDGRQYFEGYWENGDRRADHDHRWDHDKDRDYRH